MKKSVRHILAIDSALNGCGVCLYDAKNPDLSVIETLSTKRGQAEALVPMVNSVMQSADIEFKQIDLIATTIGPGTFTGLRVGISTAKSFALTLSLPIIGFSTLEVLAEEYFEKAEDKSANLCVLLDSKRADYFCQIWNGNGRVIYDASAVSNDIILEQAGSEKTIFIGDAIERFRDEIKTSPNAIYQKGFIQPNPFILSKLAFEKSRNIAVFPDIVPLYLRGADVSLPKTPSRKLQL